MPGVRHAGHGRQPHHIQPSPNDMAIPVEVAFLPLDLPDLSLGHVPRSIQVRLQVVRMSHLGESALQQFLGGIAQDHSQPGIYRKVAAAAGVHDGHAQGGALEQGPELRFRGQDLLAPLVGQPARAAFGPHDDGQDNEEQQAGRQTAAQHLPMALPAHFGIEGFAGFDHGGPDSPGHFHAANQARTRAECRMRGLRIEEPALG